MICIFCGKDWKASTEHVIPLWTDPFLTRLPADRSKPGGKRMTHRFTPGPESGLPEREWDNHGPDLKTNAVCLECNGGWLSADQHRRRRVRHPRVLLGVGRRPPGDAHSGPDCPRCRADQDRIGCRPTRHRPGLAGIESAGVVAARRPARVGDAVPSPTTGAVRGSRSSLGRSAAPMRRLATARPLDLEMSDGRRRVYRAEIRVTHPQAQGQKATTVKPFPSDKFASML
jgi:hypothetical protein